MNVSTLATQIRARMQGVSAATATAFAKLVHDVVEEFGGNTYAGLKAFRTRFKKALRKGEPWAVESAAFVGV